MVMNVRMQRMNTAICKPKDMAAWRFAKGLSLEIKKMIKGTIGINGAKNQASIEWVFSSGLGATPASRG